jgi:hypothetical protein
MRALPTRGRTRSTSHQWASRGELQSLHQPSTGCKALAAVIGWIGGARRRRGGMDLTTHRASRVRGEGARLNQRASMASGL